ncbi:hypothetical protein WHI96_14540 [Pseudonocardia tropica]|uniref:Lipoprotein n=1 Tax=Pseudonocardia tropica TaxID=681289 RepID=A0ABV1JWU4_9PSEU
MIVAKVRILESTDSVGARSFSSARVLIVGAILVVALIGAGCGASVPDPQASPQNVISSPTESDSSGDSWENSRDADPVTAIESRWGAVRRTDVVSASAQGGYRAEVTLEWHEEVPATDAGFLAPGCAVNFTSTRPEAFDDHTVRVVSVLVSVDHLVSNGFAWKPDSGFPVTYDDGATSQYFDRALTCDTANNGAERLPGRIWFEPGADPQIIQFVRSAEKTPDDPTGSDIGAKPEKYSVVVAGCDGGDCSATYRER